MTSEEQLQLWVDGKPCHDHEKDECVPDFSCCNEYISNEKSTKLKFQEAYLAGDQETTNQMLGMFLAEALATLGKDKKIYLAGVDDPDKKLN